MNAELFAKYAAQIQAKQARTAAKLAAGDPSTVAMFAIARKDK